MEAKFDKGDYIVNRWANNYAIVDSVTKKGYYHFKAYYDESYDELRDTKDKMSDLQVNYQKFWDFCTDEEKEKLDKIIKEKGGK